MKKAVLRLILGLNLLCIPNLALSEIIPVRETLSLSSGTLPDFNTFACDYHLVTGKLSSYAMSSTGAPGSGILNRTTSIVDYTVFRKEIHTISKKNITESIAYTGGGVSATKYNLVSAIVPLTKDDIVALSTVFAKDYTTYPICQLNIEFGRIAPILSTSQNKVILECQTGVTQSSTGVVSGAIAVPLDISKLNLIRKCG